MCDLLRPTKMYRFKFPEGVIQCAGVEGHRLPHLKHSQWRSAEGRSRCGAEHYN